MRQLALLIPLCLLACGRSCGGGPSYPLPSFVDEPVRGFSAAPLYGSPGRETIADINGPGLALFDADSDGDLDLWVGQGSTIDRALAGQPGAADRFYTNEGERRFRNATEEWGLAHRGWSQGAAVADVDGDGDRDLFVANWGRDALFRNDGGRFVEVSKAAGLTAVRWSSSAAFGDVNGDGHADLYVAAYLRFDPEQLPVPGRGLPCAWKGERVSCGPQGLVPQQDLLYLGRGDGSFEDVSRRVAVDRPGYGLGVLMVDVDEDGKLDILVANDSSPNFLFMGRGDGYFDERALLAGLSHSGDGNEQASMGIAHGDPDQDGDLDLLMTHFSDDHDTLYENLGRGWFRDASFTADLGIDSLNSLGWGVALADFDSNGTEDLYVSHGHVYPAADKLAPESGFAQAPGLWLGDGAGRFVPAGPGRGLDGAHVARAAAFGDIDDDGAVDIVEMRLDGPPVVRWNNGTGGRHWTRIRLRGPAGNPDAVGAKVTVTAGQRTWTRWVAGGGSFQAANDPRVLVGLGDVTQIDAIDVRWPDGRSSAQGPSPVDRELTMQPPP